MDSLERKLVLDSLLSSSGFKALNLDLKGFEEFASTQVDIILADSIGMEDIGRLNFNLGVKHGLFMVRNLLQSYQEELEDKSAESKA